MKIMMEYWVANMETLRSTDLRSGRFLPPTTGMRPGNRALFWISTVTEHLKCPFPDWLVDTRKVSPSLRAGRLLSSAPSAMFSRPLPNISWTVWVFPEKTCTILPFLLSIF
ncbi:hypothetical protein TNCV_1468401 [Trichonephila clavipes]|uniref:Uncharacterized protein n=1 Tax=Trichonephila clavipes TaxID=2585209 RepID=A0A8X6V279_TRICX|nr:hypothetical protein TNCV_1468401 [Trichonephila clavipes]